MASNIPSQTRAVDPFASYNSNVVNTLTRMVTYGEDGLANVKSCDVETLTSNTLTLKPGYIYKDDVWINITANHIIDFTDSDHYYNFDTGFDESGTYYIVLEYVYTKSRPAPQSKILILKPSQTSAFVPVTGPWFFLKAVTVTGSGPFVIDSLHDWDSTDYDNKRIYVNQYAGGQGFLEYFNTETDVSKIAYSKTEDNFYFGRANKWEPLRTGAEGASFIADTSEFDIGDLVYVNSQGTIYLADSRNSYFFADGVVSTVAVEGIVKTNGYVENVQIEPNSGPIAGNLLYLSKTTKGYITPEQTYPINQFVGRCLEVTSATTVSMIFHRGQAEVDAEFSIACDQGETSLITSEWNIGPGGYYQDIDISNVHQKNVVITCWDATTLLQVTPAEIEFIDNTIMRIWLVNRQDLNVFISGPGGACTTDGTIRVFQNLNPIGWTIESGLVPFPGSEPGTFYYQNVDVSSIDGDSGNVLIRDTVTNLQTRDKYVEFDSTSNLRIWTDTITDNLDVIMIGPKSATATAGRIYSFSSVLANFNWSFWTTAEESIPEEIISAKWGPSANSANWAPDAASTVWGSGIDSTSISKFEGLYYQDVDVSFFIDNTVVLELYSRINNKIMYPTYTEFLSLDVLRIWVDNNSYNLNLTIIGSLNV